MHSRRVLYILQNDKTMIKSWILGILLALQFLCINAQDYGGLARGAGLVRRRNNRGPLIAAIATGLVGGVAGGWITSKRLSKKYEADKRELLHFMQLQDEVYQQREKQFQHEIKKLYKIVEELEQDAVKRDYEEFKAPDADNDDMISQAEFNTYVEKYLKSFPELSEQDFPKFEEFDVDENGKVSFEEWQQFLVTQKLNEQSKLNSKDNIKVGIPDKKGFKDDLLESRKEKSSDSKSRKTVVGRER